MIKQLLLVFLICLTVAASTPTRVTAQEDLSLNLNFQEVAVLEQVEAVAPEDPPEEIMAWVEMPRSVLEGETVVLRITVENGYLKREYRMSTVEIYDDFLNGFKVISIVPEPRHKDDSYGTLELEYPIDLSPREDWELEITLQADKAGVWVGDVDVYAGDHMLTRIAQARVY